MSKRGKTWKITLVALIILAVFCCVAFYQGLTVTQYTVRTDQFVQGQSVRLALVTDLHSCIWGKNQSKLLKEISAGKPDIVLLVGDIYDDVTPPDGVRLLLEGLQGELPIYYATGNHEYWTGDMQTVLALFDEYGVTTLQDEWQAVAINGVQFVLAGVCDPVRRDWDEEGYDPVAAMQEGFRDLPEDRFAVLMAHRPNWIDTYKEYPFDLVLSGHNHGGQVRVPFLSDGLFGPDEGWNPKYPGGVYEHGELTQIVSRGLSVNSRLPRVFNPPELVFVEVTAKG